METVVSAARSYIQVCYIRGVVVQVDGLEGRGLRVVARVHVLLGAFVQEMGAHVSQVVFYPEGLGFEGRVQ